VITGILVVAAFIVLVLFLAGIAGSMRRTARQMRRTARHMQRIPCLNCGEPLLPAAQVCPNCRARVPQRGWAGRRERMWHT
jgi:hypothetical protein